jgi:stage III sporulation protein AB
MLKMIGAALVLLSGALFGFLQAQQLARRPKQIRQLIQALGRLETEISYGLTYLPEALEAIAGQTPHPLSQLFRRIAEMLRSARSSVHECWQEAVKEVWAGTSMKDSEKDIVSQLGSTLGITDREDQIKHLRLALSQLAAEEALARDECLRYEKMWKSLGILAGALIVVLIY